MGEPRDFQLLIGFAKRKYNSLDKAVDLFKRIAANQVQFHTGHSQLIEFLVAGQRAVCFTCYSHHFPPRMKKGAPIEPLLTEGGGRSRWRGVGLEGSMWNPWRRSGPPQLICSPSTT